MFGRARAECRSGAPRLRGYLLLLASVMVTIAVNVALVAAIPLLRAGVAAGAWWSMAVVCCLAAVSLIALSIGLVAYVETGDATTLTRDP